MLYGKKAARRLSYSVPVPCEKMGMGLEQHESESIITWFSQVNCFLLVA